MQGTQVSPLIGLPSAPMNGVPTISLISVFLFLLLALFLVVQRSEKWGANVLFAAFLLATSLDLSGQFLSDFYRSHATLTQLRLALALVQMPLFYFYIKKVCFLDYAWKPSLLWHGVPAVICFGVFSYFGVSHHLEIGYVLAVQVQYYVYWVVILLVLRKYKRIHLKHHSLQSDTYRWLLTITLVFILGNTTVLVRGVFELLNGFQRFPVLNVAIALFGLAAASWFVLNTMRKPELFTRVNEHAPQPKPPSEAEREKTQDEVEQVYAYMRTQKPYLEEALTLQELSAKMEMPAKRLSYVINQQMGKHFFDFINEYRIEEAKRLLRESTLTIQQIMYEVGFHSKSSFNTAFKKATAQTPSQYRKAPDTPPS
ncbi:MAG TPA: hypothetical protein DCR93_16385 [Cytophagales bacterium]|nr:hypothetical protein [Cytophagales bacterium]HAP61004.1 hypothetical protein [Cytophagales bacterium]